MLRLDIFLAAGLLLAGCCLPCCRRGPDADLSSAPASAEVDGRALRIEADLWRDFQPVAPPDGQPLRAVVRVVAADGQSPPDDVTIERLWVLKGDERWAPAVQTEGHTAHAADGPKWGPGIEVDVVARLVRGKQSWLVRVQDVTVKRTD